MALSGPELAPTSGTVKKLVILLHGVGSDGQDLIGLAPLLAEHLPDTHFISPNGCQHYDMAPYGYQWFSLMDRSFAAMLAGVQEAAPVVGQFIDQQRDRFGLADQDIALMGFSQGTMMALYAAPRRSGKLAGIVGFSGALIGDAADSASRPPVCLIHGEQDMVVPFGAMQHAELALSQAGFPVESHARPQLGHGIDPEGITVATAFLKRVFR